MDNKQPMQKRTVNKLITYMSFIFLSKFFSKTIFISSKLDGVAWDIEERKLVKRKASYTVIHYDDRMV
jgi:hypothetical protein